MKPQLTEWSAAEANGWARFDEGDVHGALSDWYDAACLLDDTPETARIAAASLQHIALAYTKLGQPAEASRYLQRALEQHYAAPPPTTDDDIRFRAECLYRMGDAFAELEEYPRAADCFARATPLALRCDELEIAIESLTAWAFVAESDGDILWGVNVLNRARELARKLPEGHALRERTEREMENILLAASEQ